MDNQPHRSSAPETARIGGGAAAAFGLLALLGWVLGLPFLASLGLGADRIPMPPSTALLFVLYGIAALLRARMPLSHAARALTVAVAFTCGLIALLLLCLSLLGIRPAAELLGLAPIGYAGASPIGHMSPVTAACFLLVSVSLLASLPFSSRHRWAGGAAWWSACLVVVTGSALLLSYLFGAPLLYGGTYVPPAATTSIAFASLGVALLALAGPQGGGSPARTAAPPSVIPRSLVIIFVVVAAGIVAVGGLYLRSEARLYRAGVEHELSAVADLKALELRQWRAERVGDASVFLDNPAFSALVGRWFDRPRDADAEAQVRAWLTKVQTHYPYDQASLLDAGGAERVSVPEGRDPTAPEIVRRVPEVLRSGEVTLADLWRDEHDQRVHMSVLVPIFDAARRGLGVVALMIDPETYLYPLIKLWPTALQTAETLLVRRDGNDVLLLNELRFQQHTTLTLRIPLTRAEMAPVRAVLGPEGIVEAGDYRGVQVIAASRAIPGSPWFLVALVDSAEANAPLREQLWVMVGLVGALLAAAAGGVGIAWREQRVRDFRGRYEAEQERAWLHDVIARSLNEVYVFDPETLRFRFANRGGCRNIGYTQQELAELTPVDIMPEFTAESFRALLGPLRSAERPARAIDTVQRRKDGSVYPVDLHLQLVDSDAGAVFLAVMNDLTERRRAETRIQHLNRLYAVLSDVNKAIVRVREPTALFAEVCRIAVDTGGFRMAWVGLLDPKANSVRPVAHAGVTDGYLDELLVGVGDGLRGVGPTGSAVREGRHDFSNDIEHDARMAPWRDAAVARGYRSSAAFPLTGHGETLGALSLYANEPGFFDDEELDLLDGMAADLSFAMEMARLGEIGLRLTTAIEQSPVSVVITDASGCIEYVNPAFTRITGYAPEEAVGGNPRMLKSGKQDATLYQELWATITAGKSWHGELVNRRKDGSLYTQELTIAPVCNTAGKVFHFVAISQDVTARKQAEVALHDAETRYRVLFEQSPHGVMLLDAETGETIEANEAAHTQLGYSREEFATLRISDYEARETPGETRRRIQKVRAEGSADFETLQRTKNGEIRNVHVWAKTLTLGDRPAFYTIFEDITDRRLAEEALRENARQLLDSQRVARLGSYQTDLLAGTWTSSVILDEILGLDDPAFRKDVPGWLSIVHPDEREEMAAYLVEVMRGNRQSFDREYRIVRLNDGQERWVHGLGRLVTDSEGRFVEMIGTIQDITERRQAEAALRSSEERYRMLFDRNLAGVYRTTADGRILECNESFARMFGYASREEALRGGANALYPVPSMRDAFLQRLRAAGVVVNHEFEGRRKDGQPVWLLENAHLVAGGELEVNGTIEGTLLDITERRRLETQLRQSQKIEAIGQLAGGVAHDFNNILGVITGYGELALRQLGADHPVRARVDQMVKAAERAGGLTRQLLAFSRKQVLRPRLLNLNAVIAETNKMLGRLIGEDIQLVVRASPHLGAVSADPSQIEQIVLNLAVNARDAMPKGGILTLETANADLDEGYAAAHPPATSGRYVMLAVSDTGIGMDQETQQRIFEPFFTTKPEGQGTGLGLATVYGIVKQSGGYIWVYSEPDRGTSFKVYLPRVDGSTEGDRPAGHPAGTLHGQETILLVEDTEALREVIRETLLAHGYTVLEAANGEAALRLAGSRQGPIDLVLTDVVMPGLGGGELAKLLSASRPGIRVLYMSGYTDNTISHHGILGEGVMLLEKPFAGDKLARAVRDALDRPTLR